MRTHFTNSELITLYVDGESTTSEEDQLFAQLANDSELQQELKNSITINSVLQPESVEIPLETEQQLFQRIGMLKENKTPFYINWMKFLHRNKLSYAYILCCLILLYEIHDVSIQTSANGDIIATSETEHHVARHNSILGKPTVVAALSPKVLVKRKEPGSTLPIRQVENLSQNDFQPMNSTLTSILPKISEALDASEKVKIPAPVSIVSNVNNAGIQVSTKNNIESNLNFPLANSNPLHSKYVIEANSMQVISTNVASYTNSLAITGMLGISDHDYVGITYGRNIAANSTVVQVTEQRSADSRADATSNVPSTRDSLIQHSLQQWYGVVYEHRFGELITKLEPSIRASIGYAGNSPVGKISTACIYHTTKNLNVTLGFEAATYVINQNDGVNSVQSLGAFLGLGFAF